ncbi:hypothetical protein BJP05_01355 [Corynebacterium sp. NML98-0116]|nr:hypothetical protein BJP05_01355 [Corynebacterium sp. NML98-0116]
MHNWPKHSLKTLSILKYCCAIGLIDVLLKLGGERWYGNINSSSNPAGLNFNSIDKRGYSKG